jgi:hypothetical protein
MINIFPIFLTVQEAKKRERGDLLKTSSMRGCMTWLSGN